MVCSVRRLDAYLPVLQQKNNRRVGSTWGFIMKVDEWGDYFKKAIDKGSWIRVGDGRETKF